MGAVELQTPIPGPKSKALLQRKRQAIGDAITSNIPVVADRAEGALIWDVDGNRLLDFVGGIGALNAGHGNPEVLAAVQEQLGRTVHTGFQIINTEPAIALAEQLNRLVPIAGRARTAFFTSGAEAVENAVKVARRATGRQGVLVFDRAFHGRTLLTLGMTAKADPYKTGFGPFPSELYRVEYPYLYHKPDGLDEESYIAACLEQVDLAFKIAGPEGLACVVIEPVAGEGGFIPAPARYLEGLAARCREHGTLLVSDEIQTGFCRTGRMFATEHYKVKADIVTMAKSLSSGFPLSAVSARADIMDRVHPNGLGGTFLGNPVSCAAALATLGFMRREKLWLKAEKIGRKVGESFQGLVRRSPHAGDARGLGAMWGLELVDNKKSRHPAKALTQKVLDRCHQAGLLIIQSGIYSNVVRTLMPLVITDGQLVEGLDIIEKAILAEGRR